MSRRRELSRRDFLRTGAATLAVVGGGPLLLTACGDDTDDGDGGTTSGAGDLLARMQEQGFARVGYANEAPFGFAQDDQVTGEAPEVAKVILERLGVPEIQGSLTSFGSLIPGLQAGRFDIVTAGMFITPERCQEVVFTDPDYCILYAFAVQQGNPAGIGTIEDIAADPDLTVGAISGGIASEQYMPAIGVDESQITSFSDPISGIQGVISGRVDAYIATDPAINYNIDQIGSDDVEATDPFAPVVDGEPVQGCGGYAFRSEDQDLRDAFNAELNDMQESGELLEVVEPFGFGEEAVSEAMEHSVEELCGEDEA